MVSRLEDFGKEYERDGAEALRIKECIYGVVNANVAGKNVEELMAGFDGQVYSNVIICKHPFDESPEAPYLASVVLYPNQEVAPLQASKEHIAHQNEIYDIALLRGAINIPRKLAYNPELGALHISYIYNERLTSGEVFARDPVAFFRLEVECVHNLHSVGIVHNDLGGGRNIIYTNKANGEQFPMLHDFGHAVAFKNVDDMRNQQGFRNDLFCITSDLLDRLGFGVDREDSEKVSAFLESKGFPEDVSGTISRWLNWGSDFGEEALVLEKLPANIPRQTEPTLFQLEDSAGYNAAKDSMDKLSKAIASAKLP